MPPLDEEKMGVELAKQRNTDESVVLRKRPPPTPLATMLFCCHPAPSPDVFPRS